MLRLLCFLIALPLPAAEHWIYLDNGHVRLGANMDAGGCIGWFSHSKSSGNLLNAYDHGRYVQQSYYGDADGSDWNGKPWCYNPVQGGSWKGNPATVIEHRAEEYQLYVKTRPRQWASGNDVSDMVFEQWLRLDGGLARLKYRMTYTGKEQTKQKHQELPAVFVNPKLHTRVHDDGTQLIRLQPSAQGTVFKAPHHWAAWVDEHDQGLGILFPHTTEATSYRVSDSGVGNCSYLAPIQTWVLKPGMVFDYEVVLAIGSVDQLKAVFTKIAKRVSQ